jgi:hypothetical protein
MPDDPGAPVKQAVIQIRLDADLARKVADKARQYGGASAVIRALLRRWVASDAMVSADDILAEVTRAPYQPRKRRKSAKRRSE